ncbi:MAG: deoxyribonuclease V [Candidatus Glassbacteria bacterium]
MAQVSWVRIRKLHDWDISPREAADVQNRLRRLVVPEWDGRKIERIAGADVSFPSRNETLAATCVMSYPELKLLDYSVKRRRCEFPYVPGFLAFREVPALLESLKGLEIEPDVIICDAQGLAHPRGMGLATHLGILIEKPTIGCAKSRLFGSFQEPGENRGDRSLLHGHGGEVIGAVLTTRSGVKPVFVSIGNLVDLETSIGVVMACCPKYRLPEPTRVAHKLAAGEKMEKEGEDHQLGLF